MMRAVVGSSEKQNCVDSGHNISILDVVPAIVIRLRKLLESNQTGDSFALTLLKTRPPKECVTNIMGHCQWSEPFHRTR